MLEVVNTEWLISHQNLLDDEFVRFEYLTAAHNFEDEFELYSKVSKSDFSQSVLLKTTTIASIDSLTGVYAMSRFHEAEVKQMFGLEFSGHQNMKNAFAVDFAGYPLLRDFALTTRQKSDWPGSVELDEKSRRRPSLPPGVHESWSST